MRQGELNQRIRKFIRRVLKFIRSFFGILEPEAMECSYGVEHNDFIPSKKDGYLQYWMDDGLKVKVALSEGETSFGCPGGTMRGERLPRNLNGGRYAVFQRRGDEYKVSGAGPDAEIFVRGKKVTEPNGQDIKSGDVIQVGGYNLVFLLPKSS